MTHVVNLVVVGNILVFMLLKKNEWKGQILSINCIRSKGLHEASSESMLYFSIIC